MLTNRVLRAMSEDTRRRLHPYLEHVRLPAGKILYQPGDAMRHAIFPERGVLSLLALTSDGAAAEIAIVGHDGVVGLPIVFPVNTARYQVLVQLSGEGLRLRADVF